MNTSEISTFFLAYESVLDVLPLVWERLSVNIEGWSLHGVVNKLKVSLQQIQGGGGGG